MPLLPLCTSRHCANIRLENLHSVEVTKVSSLWFDHFSENEDSLLGQRSYGEEFTQSRLLNSCYKACNDEIHMISLLGVVLEPNKYRHIWNAKIKS